MMTVVITGASRGIGAALAKLLPTYIDLHYILISTSEISSSVLSDYKREFPNSRFISLGCDLSNEEQVSKLCIDLVGMSDSIDFLVNSAGVSLEKDSEGHFLSLNEVSPECLMRTFKVNVLAPFSLIKSALPGMKNRNFGRILNLSSGMSRADEYDQFAPAYRMSKRALNGVTLSVHHLVRDYDIACKSICPGWVRTDMGGAMAVRSAEEAAISIVGSLLDPELSGSGKFFRDMVEINLESTTEYDHFDLGVPKDIGLKVQETVRSFAKKYSVVKLAEAGR